ncbi:uncharacterized protein LOC116576943 [Mustela erminea]|uniref:uncharacterized protein LOC116576943 n=1 Tax=Mustela erminea TaxID=36723 RepID=UPI00138699C5|nr:uncharacterized protein LOC116576943 [Mustela erminea]
MAPRPAAPPAAPPRRPRGLRTEAPPPTAAARGQTPQKAKRVRASGRRSGDSDPPSRAWATAARGRRRPGLRRPECRIRALSGVPSSRRLRLEVAVSRAQPGFKPRPAHRPFGSRALSPLGILCIEGTVTSRTGHHRKANNSVIWCFTTPWDQYSVHSSTFSSPGKASVPVKQSLPAPPPAPGGPGLSVSVDSDSRSLMREQVHDTWPLVSVLSPSGHTVVSVLSPSATLWQVLALASQSLGINALLRRDRVLFIWTSVEPGCVPRSAVVTSATKNIRARAPVRPRVKTLAPPFGSP